MKRYGTPALACLLLLFLWLQIYPFRGALAWLSGLNLSLCFALAAGMLGERRATALAVAAGIAAGAVSGSAVPPVVFAAAVPAAQAVKSAMFRPGSAFHVMSYWLIISCANFILFLGASAGNFPSGAAWAFVAAWSAADFAVFLLMLAAFRDRRRAMAYRMRR
jgi:hypothetical protein